RNRLLETIREILQTLAGAVPVAAGLSIALQVLRRSLGAAEIALVTEAADGSVTVRAYSEAGRLAAAAATDDDVSVPAATLAAARTAIGGYGSDGVATGADRYQ